MVTTTARIAWGVIATVFAGSLLSGCGLFGDDGLFRNRSADYLEAEAVPPIVVPEGLDSDTLGQLYVVPPIAATAVLDEEQATATPRPQPLSENLLEEQVKIQSYGGQRWILINRNPSEVWPRVRNILNRSGIVSAQADASKGLLETNWLEFKEPDGYYHRYRFNIEPGVQMNSTEIKVLHNQKIKDSDQQPDWPALSDSDQQEKAMVEILANALAGDLSSGSVSLLAQSIGGGAKVEILTPQVADPYILIKLDYDRTWASVSYSVSKGGFTTIDQNRSAGILYVNYREQEEKKGFFSRWLGGDDDEILRVNYQVNLKPIGEGVEVRITGPEGQSLKRNETLRLLKVVRANLS